LASGVNPFGVGSITKDTVTGKNEVHVTPIPGDVYVQSTDGNSAPMFRKDFTTTSGKTIKSARLYASALGVYDAYINGSRVSDAALSPGDTDYTKYVMYQTYDITDLLNASGDNTIGAIVGNGWYADHIATSQNIYGTDVAFIGQVEITYDDNTRQIIGTDATWKSTKNGSYVSTDNQNGETYDARKEMSGWSAPNFSDGSWINTKIALKSTINTYVFLLF
jgi:alpha-L-rhamnosidase